MSTESTTCERCGHTIIGAMFYNAKGYGPFCDLCFFPKEFRPLTQGLLGDMTATAKRLARLVADGKHDEANDLVRDLGKGEIVDVMIEITNHADSPVAGSSDLLQWGADRAAFILSDGERPVR